MPDRQYQIATRRPSTTSGSSGNEQATPSAIRCAVQAAATASRTSSIGAVAASPRSPSSIPGRTPPGATRTAARRNRERRHVQDARSERVGLRREPEPGPEVRFELRPARRREDRARGAARVAASGSVGGPRPEADRHVDRDGQRVLQSLERRLLVEPARTHEASVEVLDRDPAPLRAVDPGDAQWKRVGSG
jgi:hypothetical protein